MPRCLSASVVLECLLLVSPALAVDYEFLAPEGCPDRASFEQAITRRLQYPVASSSVQRVVVTIEQRETYHATVVLHEPGTEPVSRTLEAQDCAQAVEALALTTALAINARTREESGSSEPPMATALSIGVQPEPEPEPMPPPPPPQQTAPTPPPPPIAAPPAT